MQIGHLTLPGNVFLAPMADVTNLAFRLLCREYGASMVFSEMVDAEGVIKQSANTISRLSSCNDERPLGIQLSGSSVNSFRNAARIVEQEFRPDLIDINFGCTARHIVRKGCGSALLLRPQLMYDIVDAVSGAVNIPVTAKLRMYSRYEQTSEVACMLETAGAMAITMHSRTPDQNYANPANWEVIRELKTELSIPVIANGDIVDERSARRVLDYTGCDGIMIGRAAIGNPYIFRRIGHYLDTGRCLGPLGRKGQVNDFFRYVHLLDTFDLLDYANIKHHAKWFTKGIEGGKHVRIKINTADNLDAVLEIMGGLLEH